ncbi:MAG: hypothetical protein LBD82_00705 [Deltaproteobacteria bacterium]|jgi:hypothetical protein|nr:hypothetical protein [Deltaproteobacteria bacterium]
MQHGETIHSMLPWDIPWWTTDHAVFFGVLYLVLTVLGLGLACVFGKSFRDLRRNMSGGH